jgi:hypothetical protein
MGLRVDKLCWLTRPNPLLLIDLAYLTGGCECGAIVDARAHS